MNLNNKLFSIHENFYEHRYCNQDGFSILVCGGKDRNERCLNQVSEIKLPNFKVSKFPLMEKPHDMLQITSVNCDIFAIVDKSFEKSTTSVEIYSGKNKSWKHQYVQIEERCYFFLCSFMKKLCVIGGWVKSDDKGLS